MKQLPVDVVHDLFVPDEGELLMIYGAIGNGKTYAATADVISDLERGQVVYTTWKIDWNGFDQRDSFVHTVMNFLFFRKRFIKFDRSNWHYLDVTRDDIWDRLAVLNNCKIYFDDVIVQLFDSYEGTKFAKKKRQWAFTTRHYDRTIVLVTQRPSQVQVALRSQVNRFYKCVKVLSFPWLIFRKYEYQDMIDENVNDKVKPSSVKTYFASKRILNAYWTKNLRLEGIEPVIPSWEVYEYGFFGRIGLVLRSFFKRLTLKRQSFGAPMGLNKTNGVKELSGVPTTDKRKADQNELPF